jgi:hypothetical protein
MKSTTTSSIFLITLFRRMEVKRAVQDAMYVMPENAILCGALGGLISDMVGIPINPTIVAGACAYMKTNKGHWMYRIMQGMLGHMGLTMVFDEPEWYKKGRMDTGERFREILNT